MVNRKEGSAIVNISEVLMMMMILLKKMKKKTNKTLATMNKMMTRKMTKI